MKKLIFIFALGFCVWNSFALSFFRGIDFYTGISWTLPNFSEPDFQMGESKLKADMGFKVRFPFANLVFSAGTSNLRLIDFQPTFSSVKDLESLTDALTLRYGLSLDFSPKFLNGRLRLLVGSLSFGNSVSRLKSPVPSTSSAMKSPVVPGLGINPGLPSFSSAEKPLSLAVVFSPGAKCFFMPDIQLGATSENNFFVSMYKSFPLQSTSSMTMAINGASFVYGRSCNSSWQMKTRPFLEDRFLSTDAEISISILKALFFLSGGVMQNPFGGFYPWFRGQFSLSYPNFVLNSCFYIGDPSMIEPSLSCPGTWILFQLNPWFKFSLKGLRISTGVIFQGEVREVTEGSSKKCFDLVSRWAANFKTASRTNSVNASYKFSTEKQDWELSLGTAVSFRNRLLDYGGSLNYKFDGAKSSFSGGLSISPKKSLLESLSVSASTSIKDGKLGTTSIQGGGMLKKMWRWGTVSGKISMAMSF